VYGTPRVPYTACMVHTDIIELLWRQQREVALS